MKHTDRTRPLTTEEQRWLQEQACADRASLGCERWYFENAYFSMMNSANSAALRNWQLGEEYPVETQDAVIKRHYIRGYYDETTDPISGEFQRTVKKSTLGTLRMNWFWQGGDSVRVKVKTLRSDREPALRPLLGAFGRGTDKGGQLRVGYDKGHLRAPAQMKITALDAAYANHNPGMVSLIRIDIDGVFRSVQEYEARMLEALGGDRSMMPYVSTGRLRKDGTFEGPHAYWRLENPISTGENSHAAPIRLHLLVMRRLISRLLPLGADPGGLGNLYHGKNPFCEAWHNVYHGNSIPDLKALSDKLRNERQCDPGILLRRATELTAKAMGIVEARAYSNHVWNAGQDWCKHDLPALKGKLDEAEAAQILEGYLAKVCGGRAKMLRKVARDAVRFWWKVDQRAARKANRGAASHLITPDMDTKAAQAIGGVYGPSKRKEATLIKLDTARVALEAAGEDVTAANLIRMSGVSRATVFRILAENGGSLPSLIRCPDKKEILVHGDEAEPSPAYEYKPEALPVPEKKAEPVSEPKAEPLLRTHYRVPGGLKRFLDIFEGSDIEKACPETGDPWADAPEVEITDDDIAYDAQKRRRKAMAANPRVQPWM